MAGSRESMIQQSSRNREKSDGQVSTSDNTIELPYSPDGYILRHLESSDDIIHQKAVFPLLYTATEGLRRSCINSLNAAIEMLERINHYRWVKAPGSDPDLNANVDELRSCLEEFKKDRRLSVLGPFKQVVGSSRWVSSSNISDVASSRMLFFAFTYEANLIWLADSLLELLDIVSDLALKHPSARLWAPKGLRSLWKIIVLDGEDVDVSEQEDHHVDPVKIERQNTKYSALKF